MSVDSRSPLCSTGAVPVSSPLAEHGAMGTDRAHSEPEHSITPDQMVRHLLKDMTPTQQIGSIISAAAVYGDRKNDRLHMAVVLLTIARGLVEEPGDRVKLAQFMLNDVRRLDPDVIGATVQ